jgi:hypothetical protein
MVNHLNKSRFETVGEIRNVTTAVLNTLEESYFRKWFDIRKQFWNSSIAAGVNCFISDHFSSAQNFIQRCLWDHSRYLTVCPCGLRPKLLTASLNKVYRPVHKHSCRMNRRFNNAGTRANH